MIRVPEIEIFFDLVVIFRYYRERLSDTLKTLEYNIDNCDGSNTNLASYWSELGDLCIEVGRLLDFYQKHLLSTTPNALIVRFDYEELQDMDKDATSYYTRIEEKLKETREKNQ